MSQLSLFDQPAPKPPEHLAKITPRDYQAEAVNNAFQMWDKGAAGVLVRSPTGSGKTLTGTLIADRWLQRHPNNRVLVVAHERNLVHQFAEEIQDVTDIEPAIEMAGEHVKPHELHRGEKTIVVASRQTLMPQEKKGMATTRLGKFDNESLNWLLVIDECHRWTRHMRSCKAIIDHFTGTRHRRLGITATPFRTDKISLESLFPEVALDYRHFAPDGKPCALRDGWAVPYEQHVINVEGVDFRGLDQFRGSESKEAQWLEMVLGEQEKIAALCDPMLDIVGERRNIIFSPTVHVSRMVAAYICSKLDDENAAVHLDGSFAEWKRKRIYRGHQSGEFRHLAVVGLCREGYNDPGIQAVTVFRPTKSRSLAEQMKGRGCRPLRGIFTPDMDADQRRAAIAASEKPTCLIIDLVGVSGMPPAGSTASLYAEGKPDEVIERANRKIEKGETNPEKAVEEAEEEIKVEEEERRKREIEEQKRRQAALDAKVRYNSRTVSTGQGVTSGLLSDLTEQMMTPKQRRFLWVLGFKDIDQYTGITKRVASRMIGQFRSGASVAHVKRTNTLKKRAARPQIVDASDR